jgi:hypothetical protein
VRVYGLRFAAFFFAFVGFAPGRGMLMVGLTPVRAGGCESCGPSF